MQTFLFVVVAFLVSFNLVLCFMVCKLHDRLESLIYFICLPLEEPQKRPKNQGTLLRFRPKSSKLKSL